MNNNQVSHAVPTPERQAELIAAFKGNSKTRRRWMLKKVPTHMGPYEGVAIQTVGEVKWIMDQHGWSTEPGATAKPNFSHANFSNAKLSGIDLRSADLTHAIFDGANLSGANLDDAILGDQHKDTLFAIQLASLNTVLGLIPRMVGGIVYNPLVDPLLGLFSYAFLGIMLISLLVFLYDLLGLVWTSIIGFAHDPSSLGQSWAGIIFGALFLAYLAYMLVLLIDGAVYPIMPIKTRADFINRVKRGGHIPSRWKHLCGPNLTGASLQRANLTGVFLYRSSLQGAHLEHADLSTTILIGANLSGAYLQGTILGHARMSRSQVDSVTALSDAILDSATRLAGVNWNDVPPQYDKPALSLLSSVKKYVAYWRDRSRVLREVEQKMRNQGGMDAQAVAYRLEGLRAERKALFYEGQSSGWIGSLLLDTVAGYGELPRNVVRIYLLTVFLFAAFYYILAQQGQTIHLDATQVADALVYSVTSFHGRGFFPATNNTWVIILAAIEAVVGVFVELTLIATLNKRFLNA